MVFLLFLLLTATTTYRGSDDTDNTILLPVDDSCMLGFTKNYPIENSNLIVSYMCLGPLPSILSGVRNNILLKNGNLLIYNNVSAIIFDTNKLKYFETKSKLPTNSVSLYKWDDPFHYNFDYIKVSKNKYLLEKGIIFDEKNNKFELIPKKQIQDYDAFIHTRNYPLEKTVLIDTLDHVLYFYASRIDDNKIAIWTEDPISLKRSKYGVLNLSTIGVQTSNLYKIISAEMIENGNILLFSNSSIVSFDQQSGNVAKIKNLGNILTYPEVIKLKNKTFCIIDKGSSDIHIYNFETNQLETINTEKVEIKSIVTLLNDGKVLMTGKEVPFILFDPITKSLLHINKSWENFNSEDYIPYDGNKVLLIGRYEQSNSMKNLPIGPMLLTSRLLTIEK